MVFAPVRFLACTTILFFTLGACQAAPASEAPSPVPTQHPIRVTANPATPSAFTVIPTPAMVPTPAPILFPRPIPTIPPPPTLFPTVVWPTFAPAPVLPPTVARPTFAPPLTLPPEFELSISPAPELFPTITLEVPQLLATPAVPTPTLLPTPALHRTGPNTWLSGEAATLAREGDELFAAGRFTEAIAKYQEAQMHLDQPSQVLHSLLVPGQVRN